MSIPSRFAPVCGIALSLLCAACGHIQPPTQPAPAPAPSAVASRARLLPVRMPAPADMQAALAQISSAACPAGVDGAVWDSLCASLATAVADGAAARQAGKQASTRPTGEENEIADLEIVDDGAGGLQLEWSYVNAGDYDGNGEVNIGDLTPVGQHFRDTTAAADWAQAQAADGDGNGEVNIADVTPIGKHFGAACMSYNIYGRDATTGPWSLLGSIDLSAGSGAPRHFVWPIVGEACWMYTVAPVDAAGDDRPGVAIPNIDAVVVEEAGWSIESVLGQQVTVNGDISGMQVGQILVSGEGDGFLGRVTNINPILGGAIVSWEAVGLEELFDYADVNVNTALTSDMLESFTPAVEGLTVTPVSWSGTSAAGKQSNATLAAFRIEFPEHDLVYGAKYQGAMDFKLDAGLDFQVGDGWPLMGELEYFNFNTTVEVQGELSVKLAAKTTFANAAYLLGTMSFGAIVIFAGPVPVVFTPTIDLYCGVEGNLEIGVEFKPTVKLSATAGLRYDKSRGWDPYYDLDKEFKLLFDALNVYGKVEVTVNLFSPQPMFRLYGLAGPYASFHAPYLKVAGQIQANPPEFAITVNAGAKAAVGAKASVLGHNLVDYESKDLFDIVVSIYEAKWPLVEAPLTIDVEWESAGGPGVPVSKTWTDQPYLHVEKTGVGNWWLGYVDHGNAEAEPFTTWADTTDYDANDEATSGTTRMVVTKMEPGFYTVGMTAPVLSHSVLRVTKITLSGDFSGAYEMSSGRPMANQDWMGLCYNSTDNTVMVIDSCYNLPPPY